MNISVFKMNEDYSCSATVDIELNFEDICNKVVVQELSSHLFQAVPRLAAKKDEIEIQVSWIYHGYRVYILGDSLTDAEMHAFVDSLDPVKKLAICDMSWDLSIPKEQYTGILLGYDYNHYHRILSNEHSFIVLTIDGLDAFLDSLNAVYSFMSPEHARILSTFAFAYNKEVEKQFTREKLKGVRFLPDVNISKRGKMHTRGWNENKSAFSNYRDIKSKPNSSC